MSLIIFIAMSNGSRQAYKSFASNKQSQSLDTCGRCVCWRYWLLNSPSVNEPLLDTFFKIQFLSFFASGPTMLTIFDISGTNESSSLPHWRYDFCSEWFFSPTVCRHGSCLLHSSGFNQLITSWKNFSHSIKCYWEQKLFRPLFSFRLFSFLFFTLCSNFVNT